MKKTIIILIIIAVVCGGLYTGLVLYMRSFAKGKVMSASDDFSGFDCVLVLGAGVREDGTPSLMLADRLNTGIEIYKNGMVSKLIMSGDHGTEDYDEVNVMKAYATERGVKSEDVFMDHAGFSTYESIYRARDIFEAKKIVIVTQSYHLYRALYIAEKLGVDAVGVSADTISYGGQTYRNFRELAAYGKDFLYCLFGAKPTYLGDSVPVSGDGNVTNDKK